MILCKGSQKGECIMTTNLIPSYTLNNGFALYNLTPHVLNVINCAGEVETLQQSGAVARVQQKDKVESTFGLIDIYQRSFGEVEGLPPEEEGKYYIVSSLVVSAAKDRNDLLVPGPLVRNDQGQVIGCKGLARV
nr:MAG TPA: hypothetical protein [Caudoviricetes sp.]